MTHKFLLFDIDDTLLDFQKAQENAFKMLLEHVDVEFSQDIYDDYHQYNQQLWHKHEQGLLSKEQLLNMRFKNYFQTLGVEVDGREADNLFRTFLAQGNQLFDDVHHVLTHYQKTHQLAVVTNGVWHTQMTRLENNGLLNYFDHIFVSEQVGYQKPDERFFHHVMHTLHIEHPSQALIIGDTLHADIVGGQRVGMDTCWVNRFQKVHNLQEAPTYIVTTISEMLTLNID